MDFGNRAPEISSGLLHSGPGPASLVNAAKAWRTLAAQLDDAVVGSEALIAEPMTECQFVTDQLTWLRATAAQAQQVAVHATAAASAYGSALAAMVAPQVIAANRSRRSSLAATNHLGQLSAAIADTDADYERMWLQDAATMYVYARASASAAKLTPFSSPPLHNGTVPPRNWALIAAPEITATGQQVVAAIPMALDALSSSPLTTLGASLSPVTAPLSRLSSLATPADAALGHLNSLNKTAALVSAAAMRLPPTGAHNTTPRVSCGSGASVGGLSVPRAWGHTAPRPEGLAQEADQVDHSQ
ncbi:hypothetical protein A5647_17550 [Mycobacterium sp. 1100029.7]|nr:hypothetical protein A5647_17550 [Mycobacterium sp. 1100029.7]